MKSLSGLRSTLVLPAALAVLLGVLPFGIAFYYHWVPHLLFSGDTGDISIRDPDMGHLGIEHEHLSTPAWVVNASLVKWSAWYPDRLMRFVGLTSLFSEVYEPGRYSGAEPQPLRAMDALFVAPQCIIFVMIWFVSLAPVFLGMRKLGQWVQRKWGARLSC